MTYANYIEKITETIKIRSVNYRLSQNDIVYMSNNVFVEISRDINMDPVIQEVVMDEDVTDYDLDALYVALDNSVPLDVYRIEDEFGTSVSKYFKHLKTNVYQVREEFAECFFDEYDEDTIKFFRTSIPDFTTISNKMQVLLFDVIINGIMFYTHSAIPSPTSSGVPHEETGGYYKMYKESIERLRNSFPQV